MTILTGFARQSGAGIGLFAVLVAGVALLGHQPAAGQSEMRVRFTLNRAIDGTAAPFFVAIDKGYFRAEGLEVTIDPGPQPLDAIMRLAIASGAAEPTHDMSVGDINALIRSRDQAPATGIKAVFIVHDKPAYAIGGRKSRGVQAPKDLEGKRLGAPAADPAAQQWPLFAKLNGIDISKVTLLNVGMQVRSPMLASGEVDAITGNSFAVLVDLKDKSVPADDIVVLLMADYGLSLYGEAILASAKFQTEQPNAIRGFLRAYVLGLRDTIANPEAAVESVLSRMQGARKEAELERLQIVLKQNIAKIDLKAENVGGLDPTRFAGALEQIGMGYTYKAKPKPEDIFDAQYLPAPPPKPEPAKPEPAKPEPAPAAKKKKKR